MTSLVAMAVFLVDANVIDFRDLEKDMKLFEVFVHIRQPHWGLKTHPGAQDVPDN